MKTHLHVRLPILVALCAGHAGAGTGQFTPIGDLPGGVFASKALGISSDGQAVVGLGNDSAGQKPVRWTAAGGLQALPLLAGTTGGRANSISGDGAIVVGRCGSRSVRWEGPNAIDLNTFNAGFYSSANAISRDGVTVVGNAYDGNLDTVPYRWTSAAGTQRLGNNLIITNGTYEGFGANGVSSDGSIIVGNNRFSIRTAFRWDAGTGLTDLPFLPYASFTPDSTANACSADGAVIVGRSVSMSGYQACRWVGPFVHPLGYLPGGSSSEALAVSADGSVIVGTAATSTGPEAFYWTADGGMRRLSEVLTSADVGGMRKWRLQAATGISGDGHSIVGYGINAAGSTEGFVARLPRACYANCDNSTIAPILNVADFACFLNRFTSGDTYANCDHSTTTPVLNIADFSCFLNQFAAGCP